MSTRSETTYSTAVSEKADEIFKDRRFIYPEDDDVEFPVPRGPERHSNIPLEKQTSDLSIPVRFSFVELALGGQYVSRRMFERSYLLLCRE